MKWTMYQVGYYQGSAGLKNGVHLISGRLNKIAYQHGYNNGSRERKKVSNGNS